VEQHWCLAAAGAAERSGGCWLGSCGGWCHPRLQLDVVVASTLHAVLLHALHWGWACMGGHGSVRQLYHTFSHLYIIHML
jgi:hypothetical protein